MTAPDPASDKGFTLIEIMVSMAVMAIVLATLFKLQSSTVALSETARFKSVAPVLARQQMAVLEQEDYDPDDLSGEFEDAYAGYSWACEVETGADGPDWDEMLSDEQAEQLKKIQLTIFNPGKTRRFTLDTWRYVEKEGEDR